jgi:hypothetical protein
LHAKVLSLVVFKLITPKITHEKLGESKLASRKFHGGTKIGE